MQDEIEHVKSYLAIQEIRYAEVMQYEVNVSQELRSCTILKLVLQPLVENSIYHGIKEKGCLCQIRISAEKDLIRPAGVASFCRGRYRNGDQSGKARDDQ